MDPGGARGAPGSSLIPAESTTVGALVRPPCPAALIPAESHRTAVACKTDRAEQSPRHGLRRSRAGEWRSGPPVESCTHAKQRSSITPSDARVLCRPQGRACSPLHGRHQEARAFPTWRPGPGSPVGGSVRAGHVRGAGAAAGQGTRSPCVIPLRVGRPRGGREGGRSISMPTVGSPTPSHT